MAEVVSVPLEQWAGPFRPADQQQAIRSLEAGCVVLLPHLPFVLEGDETQILTPAIAGKSKNISLDPTGLVLRGSVAEGAQREVLHAAMRRFAAASRALVRGLLPAYDAELQPARTSFRPAEIEGRKTSWRKDDTRLHVDSFPSSPMQGKRILRVFANVNPHGKARTWRTGESFEKVARRFVPAVPAPVRGSAQLMQWLGITKGRRTAYDHYMLALHDRMKADLAYQSGVAQVIHRFAPGTSWLVFTDQVSHAAMSGQYAFEQTFYVPVHCMQDPERAPLRVLERTLERPLTGAAAPARLPHALTCVPLLLVLAAALAGPD